MSFISYAQNYEDVMLWRALKHVENGFYVDVGAQDPVIESVTKAFYDRGWRGISIEPVLANFQALQELRLEDINLQVAVGSAPTVTEFYEVVGTGLSTTNFEFAQKHVRERGYTVRRHQIMVVTLNEVLEKYASSEINFLKIDVEGSEFDALQGLDLNRFRPWILVVEATLPNTQKQSHHTWEGLITAYGYHHVYFDGLNRFYVAHEHSELDSAFKSPPNFWDAFETFREHQLNLEVRQLGFSFQESQQQRHQLELALQESQQQRERLELAFQESQQQRERLELAFQESQQQRERLELLLHKLSNSRSVRMTLPLRLVAHHARKLKQLVKKSFSIPKSLIKKPAKKVLISLAYQLSGNPHLKFVALNLLRYSPKLKHRLKLLTLTSAPSYPSDLEPTHISTLSPHALRIFHDLKKAIHESSKS